jgi:hypothetical protein
MPAYVAARWEMKNTLDEPPERGLVKSLVRLLEVLLIDIGGKCDVDTRRDCQRLRSRVEHEGDSFITIALPVFCSDFEKSLDEERIAPTAFRAFKCASGGRYPAFLQGFLSKVFDVEGSLLSEPSVDCIRAVRQLCLFGKKILRPCTAKRKKDAIDGYIRCDSEVATPSGQFSRYFRAVARILCRAFALDDLIRKGEIFPRHGPGATQERHMGNQKWRFTVWHRRLADAGFSYCQYGRGSRRIEAILASHADRNAWPVLSDPVDEKPSRLCLVPKTLKTPRIIAIEPTCMQFAQQALKRLLVGVH